MQVLYVFFFLMLLLLLSTEWGFTWALTNNSSNFRITELLLHSQVAKRIGNGWHPGPNEVLTPTPVPSGCEAGKTGSRLPLNIPGFPSIGNHQSSVSWVGV